MSPRRKIDAAERDFVSAPVREPKTPLRWGLPHTAALAFLVAAAAIAGCVFTLVGHQSLRRTGVRDAPALSCGRGWEQLAEY